jgi:hypothetical protein
MNDSTIVFIGNMNNNFFSIFRYMRDLGINAKLIYFSSEPIHFRPSCDTFFLEKYQNDITEIKLNSPYLINPLELFKLKKIISGNTFIIGCDYAPFYLSLIKSKCNVFIPYGSDLYEYPFSKIFSGSKKNIIKFWILNLLSKYLISKKQSFGIKSADTTIVIDMAQSYKKAIQLLSINNLRIGIPMVYNREDMSNVDLPIEIQGLLSDLKKDKYFVVISQSRQYWVNSIDSANDVDMKRNDILIEGFAKFSANKKNTKLLLFEYGPDVNASKDLIKTLGIIENVIWIPKMERKYILKLLKEYGSVGADQFSSGYFGGTGYEIMSQGLPLLVYVSISSENYKELLNAPFPPILNALTPKEISLHLENLYKDLDKLEAKKLENLEYFDRYLGIGLARLHIQLYSDIVKKKSLSVN